VHVDHSRSLAPFDWYLHWNRLLRQSSMGEGVDRHLLGLRLVMAPGEAHGLFADPAYAASTHWALSTSNMTPCTYVRPDRD